MAKKDYFKECKAIINSILDYLKRNDNYDEDRYYTIDILNVGDDSAKVMVCDDYLYLTKEEGNWTASAQPAVR